MIVLSRCLPCIGTCALEKKAAKKKASAKKKENTGDLAFSGG